MNIGSNWLTNALALNNLSSANNSQTQQNTSSSSVNPLFASVLSQMLENQEMQAMTSESSQDTGTDNSSNDSFNSILSEANPSLTDTMFTNNNSLLSDLLGNQATQAQSSALQTDQNTGTSYSSADSLNQTVPGTDQSLADPTSTDNSLLQFMFSEWLASQLTQAQASAPQSYQNTGTPYSYIDSVNQTVPGTNQSLANITSTNNNSLQYQSSDPEKLNQLLDGKLTGMGDEFVKAGQTYNIDPALLMAISQHESSNGTSLAANDKNNVAGMMGNNGLKSYASVGDSIMDMASNLSSNYLGKGLTSIAQIGAKYAPVGAANDPTGLNNYWVSGVTKNYQNIKSAIV